MTMAKRSYSRKGSKIQPAAMTLTFATPDTTGGRYYIDLSQAASLVNRRFYRQGINWAVAGIKVSSAKSGLFSVGKLPNTWVMSNAWEKSFRTWQKMNSEALSEVPSVRPKFLDFKIYADAAHHANTRETPTGPLNGFDANLLPVSYTGSAATPGEWISSKISVPLVSPAGAFNPGETVERELIAVGASYPGTALTGFDAVSCIEGYAASRGLPNIEDPNSPLDAPDTGGGTPENWMSAIFNEGTDQSSAVIEDMITENNIAPYPFEGDGANLDTMYPNGANQLDGLEWHDIVTLYESNATNGVGTQRVKGGNFPCGLIAIDWTPDSAANVILQIDLVPGNHRGYLCEPMTEM
jgi:hypothetical protein